MVTVIVYDVQELCQSVHISEHCLIEIVEYGIVEPTGQSIADWVFDDQAIALIKKAIRLQHDLELDWAATALAMSLLAQIEQLNADNHYLKQRLNRIESMHVNLL